MEREREREKKEKNDRFESLIKSPGSRSSGTPIKSTPCGTKLSRFYISCVECIDIESINRYSRNPRVARRRFEKVAMRNISIFLYRVTRLNRPTVFFFLLNVEKNII